MKEITGPMNDQDWQDYLAELQKQYPNSGPPPIPGYTHVYDPSTMAVTPYAEKLLGGVNFDTSGIDALKKEALRSGPSSWAMLAKQEQSMKDVAARDRAAQESAGQSAQARSNLAMRGGIDSGARERVARAGMRNYMDLSQNIGRESDLNNLQIGMTDEQNRLKTLSALPGAQAQAYGAQLDKAKLLDQAKMADVGNQMKDYEGVNDYNQKTYETQGSIYGAQQTANATRQAGGGGPCCFIFLEARYGDGTMDYVVRRFRDEEMTAKNRRGYYKLSEVLVPLMRKSKLVKLGVRALMTDPMVAYGKAYYGHGSKLGKLFKPVTKFWLGVFEYLGEDHSFIRENGEVV